MSLMNQPIAFSKQNTSLLSLPRDDCPPWRLHPTSSPATGRTGRIGVKTSSTQTFSQVGDERERGPMDRIFQQELVKLFTGTTGIQCTSMLLAVTRRGAIYGGSGMSMIHGRMGLNTQLHVTTLVCSSIGTSKLGHSHLPGDFLVLFILFQCPWIVNPLNGWIFPPGPDLPAMTPPVSLVARERC